LPRRQASSSFKLQFDNTPGAGARTIHLQTRRNGSHLFATKFRANKPCVRPGDSRLRHIGRPIYHRTRATHKRSQISGDIDETESDGRCMLGFGRGNYVTQLNEQRHDGAERHPTAVQARRAAGAGAACEREALAAGKPAPHAFEVAPIP